MGVSPHVHEFLASQHGVATHQQLLELGMSRNTIARRRCDGTFIAVLPRVVRLVGAPDSFEARAMALQLHCGPMSYLSGSTAGALHGMRSMSRRRVEITLPERSRIVRPPWTSFRGTNWIDLRRDAMTLDNGLRAASPVRMLFGFAADWNQHRFERAAEDAWHLGLVTPALAATFLEDVRRSGRAGIEHFERWLDKTLPRERPSQSGLELDLLDAVRRLGLPEPERQHPLGLRDGSVIHLDLAWPDIRLGLEPGHSWWHGGDVRQRSACGSPHADAPRNGARSR